MSGRVDLEIIESSVAPADSKSRVDLVSVESSVAPADSKGRIDLVSVETSVAAADSKQRIDLVYTETSILWTGATTLQVFDDDSQQYPAGFSYGFNPAVCGEYDTTVIWPIQRKNQYVVCCVCT
jgi:hypothetical protein